MGDLQQQQLLVASRDVATLVNLDVECWKVHVIRVVVVLESRGASEPEGLTLDEDR